MTECMRLNQRNRFVIITRFWWNFFPQRLLPTSIAATNAHKFLRLPEELHKCIWCEHKVPGIRGNTDACTDKAYLLDLICFVT